MPATQQSAVPTYKETANIQTKQVDWNTFDDRSTPGAALARLLNAVPQAAQKQGEIANKPQSQAEQEQLASLASMGAEKDRLRLAKGDSVFGLLTGKEGTMDAYEINRGRRDADLAAGALRDAYAQSGLADSDDPKAFAKFVQDQQKSIFGKLQGSDQSYYHGYVTRIGGVFEEMTKSHAGNLDQFITSKNKMALQTRMDSRVAVEMATNKERGAFGAFMDNISGGEGAGNYNAFHNHAGNQRVRFTDMTVGEVLDWQRRGDWRHMGAGSSAVGKYQFIESTLRDTVRASGMSLDTKFTPAVQDQLIFNRLVQTRGMKDYLDDKISAEQFLDSGLAKEFASLKKTNGRGEYDGDGLNKGGVSARKTLAALIEFKQAYLQDPAKVIKADSKGGISLGTINDDADNDESADAEFGVDTPTARSARADSIIRHLEANPQEAERDDIEDYMAAKKLPQADRERVLQTRDKLRNESQQRADMDEQKATQEIVDLADKAVRGRDTEALAKLRTKNYDVYQKLLDLQTKPVDTESLDNDGFLKTANYGNPRFGQDALKAYVGGQIDQETYAQAMDQYTVQAQAQPILSMPAVKPSIDKMKLMLPGDENKTIFDAQMAVAIDDLMKANDGKRPSLQEIQAAAQQVQQHILALHAQEAQVRTGRPEYANIGNQ
ncbi:hypothetical protein [Mesorhizobium sp. L2C067A000]|uniref:hypothetical protein n=1 Tax=Mesorhizobium sp. L2C067A000 TaxID=1287106 RepID=UPI0003D00663|nr:hypothetical protein [Mesorhizobium sp. L2C067A000]ESZ33216.1 membrane protein [Mesorhizobium sp. L2C067A000]